MASLDRMVLALSPWLFWLGFIWWQVAINVEAGTTLPDIGLPPTVDKVQDWASKGVMKPVEYVEMIPGITQKEEETILCDNPARLLRL